MGGQDLCTKLFFSAFNMKTLLVRQNSSPRDMCDTKDLERLQSKISTIQHELTKLQGHNKFSEFDARMSRKLNKLEKDVISIKSDKMDRDCVDYEINTVYTWKKPTFGCSHKHRSKKLVSFSDQESKSLNDTMAITASGSSPETTSRQG